MRDGSIIIYDFIFTLPFRFIAMPHLIREEIARRDVQGLEEIRSTLSRRATGMSLPVRLKSRAHKRQ
jgi:hypothetical protein